MRHLDFTRLMHSRASTLSYMTREREREGEGEGQREWADHLVPQRRHRAVLCGAQAEDRCACMDDKAAHARRRRAHGLYEGHLVRVRVGVGVGGRVRVRVRVRVS